MSYEWEAPPPRKRTGPPGKYDELFQTLLDKPGEWARVSTDDDSGKSSRRADYLRKQAKKKHPAFTFEFVARMDQEGKGGVWGRVFHPDHAESE